MSELRFEAIGEINDKLTSLYGDLGKAQLDYCAKIGDEFNEEFAAKLQSFVDSGAALILPNAGIAIIDALDAKAGEDIECESGDDLDKLLVPRTLSDFRTIYGQTLQNLSLDKGEEPLNEATLLGNDVKLLRPNPVVANGGHSQKVLVQDGVWLHDSVLVSNGIIGRNSTIGEISTIRMEDGRPDEFGHNVSIGRFTNLNGTLEVGHDSRIGDFVNIYEAYISELTVIGNGAQILNGVVIEPNETVPECAVALCRDLDIGSSWTVSQIIYKDIH